MPNKTDISTFTRYSTANRPSGSPHLTLGIESESIFDINLRSSYPITITITRDADDPEREPCIIHWDPIEDGFGEGIILFDKYMEAFEVDSKHLPAKPIYPREVYTSDLCFKQLDPGVSVSWQVDLPSIYFDRFEEGGTYKIFWAGGKIPLWNWGTLKDYNHQKLSPKLPAVVVPGGPWKKVYIEVRESEEESENEERIIWPPSPRPLLASDRVSGAPVLSIHIAGAATISIKDRFPNGVIRCPVRVTISYEIPLGLCAEDLEPVIFHKFNLTKHDERDGFRLYFREKGVSVWTAREQNPWDVDRFPFPERMNVGKNNEKRFIALMPGESWSFTRYVSRFPQNVKPGDEFRYMFKGTRLDWWNWGHFRDHEDTVLSVWSGWRPPITDGLVYEPPDNDGRPQLVVPASEDLVEFTLVE